MKAALKALLAAIVAIITVSVLMMAIELLLEGVGWTSRLSASPTQRELWLSLLRETVVFVPALTAGIKVYHRLGPKKG